MSATPAVSTIDHARVPQESAESRLRFYNTLSKKKELFSTVEPGVVRFYSCGPTVYDFAHIGNFRAFLTYDVIKRWLMYRGYEVRHVMNLTDIDDKIIRRVQQLGCTMKELTTKYTNAFFDDLDLLNIIRAQHYPRATDHIQDIEDVIAGLTEKGYAYQKEGSTYFSVSAFGPYGRLAELEKRKPPRQPDQQDSASALENESTDSDEYDKEDARDFALWKAWKKEDGDILWKSRLGNGRPGWHIECSCMAMKFLGPELDIHGGGIDLVFPHHENEIAQSEALTGRPFARYWLHNGFVNVDNEKMSKSLGNFRTLRDIVKKPDDARAFRYLVVTSQYRSALAFTEQCLKSARNTVKRLDALRKKLISVDGQGGLEEIQRVVAVARNDFVAALDDDLNTPRAAAAMFALVNAAEKMIKQNLMGAAAAAAVTQCLDDFDRVWGIKYAPELEKGKAPSSDSCDSEELAVPQDVTNMLHQRNAARKQKDFQTADKLRDAIGAAGYAIVDTPQGTFLHRKDT